MTAHPEGRVAATVTEATRAALAGDGVVLLENVATADECDAVVGALNPAIEGAPGRRSLLGAPAVDRVTRQILEPLASRLAGEPLRPVKATLFDKSADANWTVALHQDLAIAVARRHDLPGFANWTAKDGVPHVQPPLDILQRVLALRLHLDDADADAGALRVILRSHAQGRWSDRALAAANDRAILVPARRGDIIVMRPLLVHGSRRCRASRRRRVLHVELAPAELLPVPLVWHSV